MTGNADHDTQMDAPGTPTDVDRYASVAVDHEETIIYDREIEDAWIQSDAAQPLQDLQ